MTSNAHGAFDVFISYARVDRDAVLAIERALIGVGLVVWRDETDVPDFESISRSIQTGLLASKTFLTYYSKAYPTRRACQWELTAAYIASLNSPEHSSRLLVVNPERDGGHIEPIALRDRKFHAISAARSEDELAHLAVSVARVARGVDGVFGSLPGTVRPQWYGWRGLGSNRFQGRLAELWQIHSALHGDDFPLVASPSFNSYVQVRGMGGIGKSLLCEEYALRFGAAYPGGVFWLSGGGDQYATLNDDAELFRQSQVTRIADELGISPGRSADHTEGLIAEMLRYSTRPYLWIVDDLPPSSDEERARRWSAPTPGLGKTLVTTRDRGRGAIGTIVDLGVLDQDSAVALLSSRRAAEGESEKVALSQLAEGLGYHALALDVAGGAMASLGGSETFAGFLAKVSEPDDDVLALVSDIGDQLPNGHERSIAATLGRSIRLLQTPGRRFLSLAATLASGPLPARLVDSALTVLGVPGPYAGARGAAEAVRHSLAEPDVALGAWTVHRLISRTVAFLDKDTSQDDAPPFRQVAIDVLLGLFSEHADRVPRVLQPFLIHARHLVASPTNTKESDLLFHLGRADFDQGMYRSARRSLEQYVALEERLVGEHIVAAMFMLPVAMHRGGDSLAASHMQADLVAMCSSARGKWDPRTLVAVNNLASMLRATGDAAQARYLQEVSLEGLVKRFGADDERTLATTNNLAVTIKEQGDVATARLLLERVLGARERTLGNDDLRTIRAAHNLGASVLEQGDVRRAKDLLERAVEGRRKLLGDDHPDTLTSRSGLARLAVTEGDFLRARSEQEAVVDAWIRNHGADHPDTLQAAWFLILILVQTPGASEAAKDLYERFVRPLFSKQDLSHLEREILEENNALFKKIEEQKKAKGGNGPTV